MTFISSKRDFLFCKFVFLLTWTCAGFAAAVMISSIMLSQSMPETTPEMLIDGIILTSCSEILSCYQYR